MIRRLILDGKSFFKSIRASVFGGTISQSQMSGIGEIINAFYAYGELNADHLAYVLATAYHETGGTMAPVREGFAKTDKQAVEIVTRMYKSGKISRNYAERTSNGNSYYGRGFVQLTWEDQSKRAGDLIGQDLHGSPELAMNAQTSARILVEGMRYGWFTGKTLGDYTDGDSFDYVNARRIVNGTDRAEHIAGIADKFRQAIAAAAS